MASQEESIPAVPQDPEPPPANRWEGLEPWRETFLYHVTDPEVHSALRVLGGQIYEWVLDWQHWPDEESPMVVTELRSAARELRHLESFLVEQVAASTGSDDRGERRLCVKAEDWGAALGRVAHEIEAAVAT